MQALQQWHIWSRTGGEQSRPISVVAKLLDRLPESQRTVIESWLSGSLDRVIAQRLAMPIEYVARIRFDSLIEANVRLAQRPVGSQDAVGRRDE